MDIGGSPGTGYSQPLVRIYDFRIDDGSGVTQDRDIVLYHSATNNPQYYRVSESSISDDTPWIPYVANPTFTLSANEGVKKIYLQIKGSAEVVNQVGQPVPNIATASATVGYYPEPLVVSDFRTVSGSNSVSGREVRLTWNVSGGATGQHRISESENMQGVSWQDGSAPPPGGVVYNINEGAFGPRVLYLQIQSMGDDAVMLNYTINLTKGICPLGHRGLECSGAGTCQNNGECACNPDISGPACETICQRCYGAAGNNCGVADGMPTGVCYTNPLGQSVCNINAGSWAHDECCIRYRTGGPNKRQGSCTYPGLGPPPYYCQGLMNKAVQHLSIPALTWRRYDVDFSKSYCTNEVEMPVTHADMCNPSGGTLLCADKQYCCSRTGKPALIQPPAAAAFGQVCVCD